jgi:Putative transposase
MTVHPYEFIRRFLIHVLPKGLHRIRHYGLLANGSRKENLAKARALLNVPPAATANDADTTLTPDHADTHPRPCPCCGARMLIIETFEGVCRSRHHASPSAPMTRIDTS